MKKYIKPALEAVAIEVEESILVASFPGESANIGGELPTDAELD